MCFTVAKNEIHESQHTNAANNIMYYNVHAFYKYICESVIATSSQRALVPIARFSQ